MRPGPKKPGESAAEYSARVKAMEQKWMSGMGRPKTGGGPSSVKTPGPRVSDTRGPNYPKNPVRSGETKTQYLDRVRSEKGGSSGGKGGSSSGGGRRDMGPVRGAPKGPAPMPRMKRGGTVKGKK